MVALWWCLAWMCSLKLALLFQIQWWLWYSTKGENCCVRCARWWWLGVGLASHVMHRAWRSGWEWNTGPLSITATTLPFLPPLCQGRNAGTSSTSAYCRQCHFLHYWLFFHNNLTPSVIGHFQDPAFYICGSWRNVLSAREWAFEGIYGNMVWCLHWQLLLSPS